MRISKRGYVTRENTVEISVRETRSISVNLQHIAFLTVRTLPQNASIIVNGNKAGKGFLNSYEVAAGDVSIQVEAPGYEVFKAKERIGTGQTKKLQVKQTSSFGVLEVKSDPPGAEVTINEKKAGQTPYTNTRIMPGNYSIKVELSGHDVFEADVDVPKGERRTVEADLISKFGTLEVISKPKGAHVYLNEKVFGKTPYNNFKLEPDNYILEVYLKNSGVWTFESVKIY